MVTNPVTGRLFTKSLMDIAKAEVQKEYPHYGGVDIGQGYDGRTMVRLWGRAAQTWRPLKTLDGTLTKNLP